LNEIGTLVTDGRFTVQAKEEAGDPGGVTEGRVVPGAGGMAAQRGCGRAGFDPFQMSLGQWMRCGRRGSEMPHD